MGMNRSLPSQQALSQSMESCSLCHLGSPEDYELSDFVSEEYYYNDDIALAITYERAVHKLKHRAGPAFMNHKGKRVWFEDLDEVVQSGMITALTRPIDDKEEFIRSMPKGKWSDYSETKGMDWSRGTSQADQMSKEGRDTAGTARARPCRDEQQEPRQSRRARIDMVESSLEKALPSSNAHEVRKDSAHSIEEVATNSALNRNPDQISTRTSAGTSRDPQDRPRQQHSKPHETIAFVDNLNSMARRTVPGLVQQWHPSKYRVAPTSAELLAERGQENVIARPHPLRAEGRINSTLSKPSPLTFR